MKSMCLRVLLLVALIAASTGCNTASSLPVSATPTPPSTLVQNPLAPGKAGLTGRVVATEGDKPIASTVVRLAQVHRGTGDEGAFVLDGANSPGTMTTSAGYFVFQNVDAFEYVLVVGDAMGVYAIVADKNGKARVWALTPDAYFDAGTIRVTLPH
jgi:hypothetical protein